jgi:hypothetical protein
MTDNPTISPQRLRDDLDAALRAKSLGEFVGQVVRLGSLAERTYA